jgi:hypothetical protein
MNDHPEIRIQDDHVRQALIELGWTPPKNK